VNISPHPPDQSSNPDTFATFPSLARIRKLNEILAEIAPDLVSSEPTIAYPEEVLATTAENREKEPEVKAVIGDPFVRPDHGPWWLSDRIVANRRYAGSYLRDAASSRTRELPYTAFQQLFTLGNRIEKCRETFLVLQHIEERHHIPLLAECNSRWCPVCAVIKSLRRARKVAAKIETLVLEGLITHAVFTVPNCPVGELLDTRRRLTRAFRRLFGGCGGQSEPIPPMEKVRGYIWSLEITWSETRHDWHPHIHALLETPYLDQAQASEAWELAAGTQGFRSSSWHVFLQRVRTDESAEAALEISKYISKPILRTSENSDAWVEAIVALHRCHQSDSGGTLSITREKKNNMATYEVVGSARRWLQKNEHTRASSSFLSRLLKDPLLGRIAAGTFDPWDLAPLIKPDR